LVFVHLHHMLAGVCAGARIPPPIRSHWGDAGSKGGEKRASPPIGPRRAGPGKSAQPGSPQQNQLDSGGPMAPEGGDSRNLSYHTCDDGYELPIHDLGGSGIPLLVLHANGFNGPSYRPMVRAECTRSARNPPHPRVLARFSRARRAHTERNHLAGAYLSPRAPRERRFRSGHRQGQGAPRPPPTVRRRPP